MRYRLPLLLMGIFLYPALTAQNRLPIKPERTISITTTEGSYMDVDISSDGKRIVFDLLGDLYMLPAEGGEAVQLTRGLPVNRYPVFSPDGKQLAFMSDAFGTFHVNLMNIGTRDFRALNTQTDQSAQLNQDVQCFACIDMPRWTPDGAFIAAEGRLYHLTGRSTILPDRTRHVIGFSADEKWMYYGQSHNDTLRKYDRVSGIAENFFGLSRNKLNPVISPDGRWLAYVKGPEPESSLWLCNLITGEEKLLIPALESNYRIFDQRYTFTPFSDAIIIGYGGKIHRIEINTGKNIIIPFSATMKIELGAFDNPAHRLRRDSLKVRYTQGAALSPDGKTLVFSALNRLYTMPASGGIPHRLTIQDDGQFQPDWSPDGKWIAYVTWNDVTGGQLWKVPASGGRAEQLTSEAAHYQHPVWSPDGEKIALLKDSARTNESHGVQCELDIISLSTRRMQKLADSIYFTSWLTFSMDGKYIYTCGRSEYRTVNGKRIVSLAAISLNYEKHKPVIIEFGLPMLHHSADDFKVTISPDSRFLVVGTSEDLYLMPYPRLGNTLSWDEQAPIIRFCRGGLNPHWREEGRMLGWSFGNRYFESSLDSIIAEATRAVNYSRQNGPDILHEDYIVDIPLNTKKVIDIPLVQARSYARGAIALRNVRIITMESGQVIEKGTILIEDGQFKAIGPADSVIIPHKAKIVDLDGKTIIPGLIDLHDHMELSRAEVLYQQRPSAMINLSMGITTARDPSSSTVDFGYAELIETGQMLGPRLFTVGYPVAHTYMGVVQSLEDARAIVGKKTAFGAFTIKEYSQPTRMQRQWLLIASREAGLQMTNEGHDFYEDIAMLKDGCSGIEHVPGWGDVYQDMLSFWAQSGTWHTPTLQVGFPDGFRGLPYFLDSFRIKPHPKAQRFWTAREMGTWTASREPQHGAGYAEFMRTSTAEARLRKMGGHVTMGSHGNWPGIGAHWEIQALQMGGLTNMEALESATILAAAAMGMEQDIGSIKSGKLADLVILDKNPLENIRHAMSVCYVMKDGILYDGNTLSEIWPEKKKCPEWKYVVNNLK